MSFNVWATWDKDAGRLFRRMAPSLFYEVNQNPIALFHEMDPEQLKHIAEDPGFMYEMKKVYDKFSQYMGFRSTYEKNANHAGMLNGQNVIAYLSMEYGLHESLPIYSGGLGILSGDHLKAASDIGFPLVGVGLLYSYGYFDQDINMEGYQEERYTKNNWYLKPIKEVKDESGKALKFKMKIKDFDVHVKIWRIDVGKVPLYLLDTDIPENTAYVRSITDQLYVSDRKRRLEQEILLGQGAPVAFAKLEIQPRIYHLNEGHSAFLIIERLKELIKDKKMSFESAKQYIRQTTVFTTHTPVVEGNEHFDIGLIRDYLKDEITGLGLSFDEFLKYGHLEGSHYFWLPAFAVMFSRYSNGVSKLHGEVSRSMWKALYPTLDEREVPIDYVTNGVHLQTWLSTEITYLFDRYVGPDYMHRGQKGEIWQNVERMPDSEIWEAHKRTKSQLITFVRQQKVKNLAARGASVKQMNAAEKVLNPEYLTVGFARRFASYKRANLILQDKERLVRILKDSERPVQFIFAGKAHPADGSGKRLIKEIIDFGKNNHVEDRFVFLENYTMSVAKRLVQGVDVWLNTPIKPMEASGTSGMKAGMNGVLNFSVPDGWWPECYNGVNGWSINAGDAYDNPEMKRIAEANQIYQLLEDEIAPCYYDQNGHNYSELWVKRMKNAILTVGKGFNMHRMLRDYYRKFYLPEIKNLIEVEADGYSALKEMEKQLSYIQTHWKTIRIKDVFTGQDQETFVEGARVDIDAYLYLGDCLSESITVELLYQISEHEIKVVPLEFIERYEDKSVKYKCVMPLEGHGLQGFNVRVRPASESLFEAWPTFVKYHF
jgi:starch phosphorylase